MKLFFKGHRFWVMGVLALSVLAWYFLTDPNHGAETLSRIQWLGWITVIAWPVYLMRRAFFPEARSHMAFAEAMKSPTGAGLVFLGLCIFTGILFLAFSGRANSAELPAGAVKYLPALASEQRAHWPDMPLRSSQAAQVEQETCIRLSSPRCWNPTTELKTDREYGFGLGQITVTSRFDNFKEARKLDVSLRDWQWPDRYDPARQLRVLVLMDKSGFERLAFVADPHERLAMAYSAYNGGLGGVLSDRRLCASIKGCDPGRWFGHVENTSLKQKTVAHGYGQSFFQINRGYVQNVMIARRGKYARAMGSWARDFSSDIESWELLSEDPLTLSPSLLCRACGDHGFIRDGKWVKT